MIIVLGVCHQAEAQTWKLVWSDEFDNGSVPDPSRWDYDLGTGCPQLCGWGNNEKQAYTRRPKNARLENGLLIIEAHQESLDGGEFTSARLVTRGKASWQYGRIEVRAKLPGGRGAWPAIWMLPENWTYGGWPRSGEIDIMEHVGYNPLKVLGTVHCEAYNHMYGTQRGDSLLVADAEDAFHVYAIEWYADKIDFWVDKTQFFTFPRYSQDPAAWPFNQPFHLILNLAVGGNLGGRYGVTPYNWPRRMEVDYVRVYQQEDSR
jgi:beta-glucanase (GH16 family)